MIGSHSQIYIDCVLDFKNTKYLKSIILESENPTLLKNIRKFFEHEPSIVQIPRLQWDQNVKNSLDVETLGYLTLNDIHKAHDLLREKTLSSLLKIFNLILEGVSHSENYLINCQNFENMIERLYQGFKEEMKILNC